MVSSDRTKCRAKKSFFIESEDDAGMYLCIHWSYNLCQESFEFFEDFCVSTSPVSILFFPH